MANVRIKDLTTTAATTASDDFFGVDGATNGTRKLNAYSPTFGGNLTVSGTGTHTFGTTNTVTMAAGNLTASADAGGSGGHVITSADSGTSGVKNGFQLTASNTTNTSSRNWALLQNVSAYGDLQVVQSNAYGGSPITAGTSALSFDASRNATLSGNLTVSGTGNSSVAGTLLVATTTNSSNGKIQLADHTTSAGGIGFGNQMALYLTNPSDISLDALAGNPILRFRNTGTEQFRLESSGSQAYFTAANSIIMRPGGVTALTLDSSQRAQFAGNIGLGAAPLANIGVRNSLSLTASGGSAYVYQSGGTLTSAANNDSIFGLSVDNAYSNAGSYTNVSAGHLVINARSFSGFAFGYGIRIGNITGATSNFAIRTGSGVVSFEDSTASTTTGTGALQVSGGAGIAGAVNVGTYYGMVDGVTAPSATSGYAKIYVDTADGDLKVIFGDGTIKTIATDT